MKARILPTHLWSIQFDKSKWAASSRTRILCESCLTTWLLADWKMTAHQHTGMSRSLPYALQCWCTITLRRIFSRSSYAVSLHTCIQRRQQLMTCDRSRIASSNVEWSKYVIYYYYKFLCALCVKLILWLLFLFARLLAIFSFASACNYFFVFHISITPKELRRAFFYPLMAHSFFCLIPFFVCFVLILRLLSLIFMLFHLNRTMRLSENLYAYNLS